MSGRSRLYAGRVSHTRLRPFRHQFEYRVFYGMFDIDELSALDAELRWFGHNRRRLFGFYDRDHGPRDGSNLRNWINRVLADAGVDGSERIELLCYPRVLGYVFNPLSIWYCYDGNDRLVAVVHEVKNTFGEQHAYVVPLTEDNLSHEFEKELHVSPFLDMHSTYRFSLNLPGDHISVGIRQHDPQGELFRAGMRGTRVEMTDANLLKLFTTHPLVTLKTIAAIHFEAIRLWRKGARYHRRPPAPREAISVIGSDQVSA